VILGSSPRPPRRRTVGLGLLRWLGGALVAAALFGAGVAVGQALEDRPQAAKPVTSIATIKPWTQTNRITETRTVTVEQP
jgi:hypothetical protein